MTNRLTNRINTDKNRPLTLYVQHGLIITSSQSLLIPRHWFIRGSTAPHQKIYRAFKVLSHNNYNYKRNALVLYEAFFVTALNYVLLLSGNHSREKTAICRETFAATLRHLQHLPC